MSKKAKKSTWMNNFILTPKHSDIDHIEMERKSRIAAGRHSKNSFKIKTYSQS